MAKIVTCKICGKEIAKSASTCPHCGAKLKRKHPVLGAIVFILALSLIGAVIGGGGPSAKNSVTKEEFDKIETGMSYEEVVKIIGFEGEMNSQVDIGAGDQFKTEIYTWANSNGTNMNATFQGGRVVSKAQIGLT